MTARRKERVEGEERAKAAFLAAYRELCTAHGYMVIFIVQDDAYSHFAAAHVDVPMLEGAIQEMLVTNAYNIVPDEDK